MVDIDHIWKVVRRLLHAGAHSMDIARRYSGEHCTDLMRISGTLAPYDIFLDSGVLHNMKVV